MTLRLYLHMPIRRCTWEVMHTQDGYTALIHAASNGHAACVRLLLDAGADKEAKDNVRVICCVCCACVYSFCVPCFWLMNAIAWAVRHFSNFFSYSCIWFAFGCNCIQSDFHSCELFLHLFLSIARVIVLRWIGQSCAEELILRSWLRYACFHCHLISTSKHWFIICIRSRIRIKIV